MAGKNILAELFADVIGHPPLPWQVRLYEGFLGGTIPRVVDIPSGSGRSSVIAVWLAARASGAPVPRRLAYAVDSAAVIDRATPLVEACHGAVQASDALRTGLGLDKDAHLPIATLRGAWADSTDWLYHPHLPAIIVGSADTIGSALLFSGYGIHRSVRSLAAATLACDCLIVVENRHLMPSFEALLRQIEGGSDGIFGPDNNNMLRLVPKLSVMAMEGSGQVDRTATGLFTLNDDDLSHPVLKSRLAADKNLTIHASPPRAVAFAAEAVDRAWSLGEAGARRILVFVSARDDALRIKTGLDRKLGRQKAGVHSALLLEGQRTRERRALADWLSRFGFAGASADTDSPVFLISTLAGEISTDLDADAMVCDLLGDWPRMVRRFARVGRTGDGQARIAVIDKTDGGKQVDAAVAATRALLEALPESNDGGRKAGPEAVSGLAARSDLRRTVRSATVPAPLYPGLDRATVDAWALTSLFQHTGRPRIGPWIHGWQERPPRTAVIWRHFLPVAMRETDRGQRFVTTDNYHVSTYFEAARPLHAETLWSDSGAVLSWLIARLTDIASEKNVPDPIHGELHSLTQLDAPVAIVLSPGGGLRLVLTHRDILNLSRASRASQDNFCRRLWGRRLIVDARLRGLANGYLDAKATRPVTTPETNWSAEEGVSGDLPASPYRIRVTRGADRGATVEDGVIWQEIDAFVWRLDEDEIPVRWLSVEARDGDVAGERHRITSPKAETLEDHVRAVCGQAAYISDALGLSPADQAMLVTAARHHDAGKTVRRFQRAYGFSGKLTDPPYAKSSRRVKRSILSRYRHELISTVKAENNGLDLDRDDPRYDLALHLIASHHGQARPSIGIRGIDDLPPRGAEAAGFSIAQRFGRQQRLWGPWGLAWWESLLRGANYRASRAQFQTAIKDSYR